MGEGILTEGEREGGGRRGERGEGRGERAEGSGVVSALFLLSCRCYIPLISCCLKKHKLSGLVYTCTTSRSLIITEKNGWG